MNSHASRPMSFLIAFIALAIAAAGSRANDIVVDFEDLPLDPNSAAPADAQEMPFTSHKVTFNRTWNHTFDCCPGGFAYSNQTDLSTAGFSNPYSAYVLPDGGGADGSGQFAIANSQNQGEAVVTLSEPASVVGAYVTNTTYGYLAAINGDDGGAGFVKGPFSNGDWFRIDFIGIDDDGNETGVVEFYLADYRDGQSLAVSDWTWIDLSALGRSVKTIEFAMASTDTGPFGMNTPAYFAIDNLTIRPVPEPSAVVLVLCVLLAMPSLAACNRPRVNRAQPSI